MSDDHPSSPPPPPPMADDIPAAHPTTGGKSIAAVERPRYKSWRKKYRKMHADFNTKYDTNRHFFKEEQRLEAIAKRLREEINGLLEICLDINHNSSIPPELRFNVSLADPPPRVSASDEWVKPDITPEEANADMANYNMLVRQGKMTPLDLVDVRAQIDNRLAAQGTEGLEAREQGVSQPIGDRTPADVEHDLAFLPFDQEMDYLTRLDVKLGASSAIVSTAARRSEADAERHYADLTPRELERKTEVENPQSQHNWLRTHTKVLAGVGEGGDGAEDTESIASHDVGGGGRKRKSAGVGKGNLARQAVERARDGSAAPFSNDEDELASDGGGTGGMRRKGVKGGDPDGTYRLKGGSGKGTGNKGKRKRTGEDSPRDGASAAGPGKKAKVEPGAGGGSTPVSAGASGLGMGGSEGMGLG